MYSGTIAIPTQDSAGMQGQRSEHFGHSPYFTLVDLINDQVREVKTIANAEHGPGGCGAVVRLLQEQQADAVIAAGMGNGPLTKLVAAGIAVLFADHKRYPDVQSVVDDLRQLRQQPFVRAHLCKGSGNCHQHGTVAKISIS